MARAARSSASSSEEETARIAAARALLLDAVYYSDGQNLRFFGRDTTSTSSSSASSSDASSAVFDRGDVPPVMLTCPAKKIQVHGLLSVCVYVCILTVRHHVLALLCCCASCSLLSKCCSFPIKRVAVHTVLPLPASTTQILKKIELTLRCPMIRVAVAASQVLPYAMAGEAADGALRVCDMQVDSPLKARYNYLC